MKESESPFITLANRQRWNPFCPDPAKIDIATIAYSLAGIWRWGGHSRPRISVAEHSVRVAELVEDRLKYAALLHDAPEFCSATGDIQGPIKPHVYFVNPETNEILCAEEYETDLLIAIMEAVGCHDISVEDWSAIYRADDLVCATEARDLMPYDPVWDDKPKLDAKIVPWPMERAEAEFLRCAAMWKELQRP